MRKMKCLPKILPIEHRSDASSVAVFTRGIQSLDGDKKEFEFRNRTGT
jgi:hypothetical protein